MKNVLIKQLNKPKILFFIIYIVIALFLTLYLALSQAEWLQVVGVVGILALIPFFFTDKKTTLIALLITRPIMDIVSDYTVVTYRGISLNVSSVLGIIIFIWGIYIIAKDKIKLNKIPIFWPALAFIFISGASLFVAESLSLGIGELIKLSNIIIIFILSWQTFVSKKEFGLLIKVLLASIFVPACFAVYQLIFKMGLNFGGLSNRLYGTFGHPNAFAFYLVFIIAIAILVLGYAVINKRKHGLHPKKIRQEEWPQVILILFLFTLILFTYTRGAWIALVVFLLTLGFLKYRKHLIVGLALVGITVLLFIITKSILLNRYQYDIEQLPLVSRITSKNEDADSIDWRINMYQEMMPLIWEKPILGNGLGSFTLVRARITANPYEALEAHNDYLRLAIETGLVGLLSYIILILSILIKIVSLLVYNKKNQPDMYLWIIGLFGLAIGFFVMSISDNMLRNTAMQWAFWAYMAGVFAIGKKK